MKKVSFGLVILAVFTLAMASSAFGLDEDSFAEKFSISGKLTAYGKIQNDYQTPLDDLFDERGGANYRSNQHFRAFGEINFLYGKPGDQFFGVAQLELDPNDPDHDDANDPKYSDSSVGVVDVNGVFINYRPFEVRGARPLGISVGILPIEATANAAYFTYFEGDREGDFILYTSTALTKVPGVNLDFHISEDTGLGIAYIEGIQDGSEIGALMEKDSAKNIVLWGEAKKFGFGFNGAIQFVEGEAAADVDTTTPGGNTLANYSGESSHTLMNAMLTYRKDFGSIGFMPAIGIQRISGEKCEVDPLFSPERDIELNNFQVGLKFFTNFFNIPGEFSVLYTYNDTDDFNGLGTISSAGINSGIDQAFSEGTGAPSGTWTASNPPAVSAALSSKTVAPLAGIDSDIHIQYKFKLSKNVEIGAYFYQYFVNDISASEIASKVFSQLDGSDTNTQLTAMVGSDAAADQILQGYSNAVGANLKQNWEWTDTQTYGIVLNILF